MDALPYTLVDGTKYINLTPVNIVWRSDPSNDPIQLESDLVFAPSGQRAIIDPDGEGIEMVGRIPHVGIVYSEVLGIPEQVQEGVYYLVSFPTALHLAQKGRTQDIRYPDTLTQCIRNEKNQPFATRRFLFIV